MKKLIYLFCFIFQFTYSIYPTVIFHGIFDDCNGWGNFAQELTNKTGAYFECIEIGDGSITTFFSSMEIQAEEACEKIKSNPMFNDTRFNIMGLSQGGLIGRYIVESCDTKYYVNNLLTIATPHLGVQAPSCIKSPFCSLFN